MTLAPGGSEGRYLNRCGATPLAPVRLDADGPAIWCKLEFLNPSGSTKDRIARYILEKAWRNGELAPGGTAIEASSGSTSIAMALACAQLGFRFIAVLNEGVSRERLLTIRSFGGEIVAVPKSAGIAGAIAEAARIARERGCFYARQFENPDNAEAHRVWTGQEILAQLDGRCIDAVVSGVGTGGTIVGLYRAFEEAGCRAVPFVARPVTGAATRDVECSSFSSRVPGVVECASTIYREANLPGAVELDVDDDLALETTRRLHARGFPVGPSSGLNYAAAVAAARRLGPESTVVTVFPDRMERYFSTELFQPAT